MDHNRFLFSISEIGKSTRSVYEKGYRTYTWRSNFSNSEIHGTEAFYFLASNVRISRFIDYAKLTLFLEGLSEDFSQALYDFPGVLSDTLFVNALRAKNSLLSEGVFDWSKWHTLQERVQQLRLVLGRPPWSQNLLHAYRGNLRYELLLGTGRIRKVRKYTGYVKTPSAVGSKQSSIRSTEMQSEIFDSFYYEEKDLVPYLLSPTEDYNLLGFNAESPLYSLLIRYLKERSEAPEFLKKLYLYNPDDSENLGSLI